MAMGGGTASRKVSHSNVDLPALYCIVCGYAIVCCAMAGLYLVLVNNQEPTEASPIYFRPRVKPLRILTLFTSVNATRDKEHHYRNTIANWGLFADRVHLTLYHGTPSERLTPAEKELHTFAVDNGWLVRQIATTSQGVPGLRSMFIDAQQISDTPYYAFCNGDILFTNDLLNTLDFLYDYSFQQILMVGRRTNYNVSIGEGLFDWAAVKAAAIRGYLFNTNAIDYFVTKKNGFPWKSTPNFVIGRIGYDNWMIVASILQNIPVVDVTRTVLAVHQTGSRGNFEGHNVHDVYVNYRLAGSFNYDMGQTKCAPFFTTYNSSEISITHREQDDDCKRYYRVQRRNPNFFKYAIVENPVIVNGTDLMEIKD